MSFDDYHDKFYWVIEGLNYMLDGVRVNDREPRLYWDMGWFISNKIGRDDAAKYYRRLFSGERGPDGKDPPDYVKDFRERFTPPTGFPPGSNLRDNWHVGKAWFLAAESKIDPPRYPVRGMAPVIFYSDAPTCQFYYADNLEKDGIFGQVAQRAWQDAENEWHAFGERAIDTSYDMASATEPAGRIVRSGRREEGPTRCPRPGSARRTGKEKRGKPQARGARGLGYVPGRPWTSTRRRRAAARAAGTRSRSLQPDAWKLTCRNCAEARPDEIARRAPQAHRQEAMNLAKEIEQRRGPGHGHQPRTDEGQLRFLADAGQGRADGRVPGRAEGHPRRRPGLRQRRHDPRPAGI